MNKLKKIAIILRTVRYLKWTQVFHQIKNRLRKAKPLSTYNSIYSSTHNLDFFGVEEAYPVLELEKGEYNFHFLNLSKNFGSTIDWNFQEYGKLWNYNLQYLDCLKQKDVESQVKIALIHSIYSDLNSGKLKLEPYPASLRIMNLIRFVSIEDINEEELVKINSYIKSESSYLKENLEYHLLANHLLENLFAMNMAARYFNENEAINKYESLIKIQLEEQILNDGAHYELSPMYHKIIFFRVLEAYYFLSENSKYKNYLKNTLSKMLCWLKNMSFQNGEVPDFNDSTKGITFSNLYFYKLCETLGIQSADLNLSDSGYRKYNNSDFEIVMDVNGIAPPYQPGHAHADTFSFCLNYRNQPIIVDSGISTYNIGERRSWERSTNAHNTIEIEGENSAEVWSGFRVGRRLNVKIIKDNNESVVSLHDGYKHFGIEVKRSLILNSGALSILDEIIGETSKKIVLNLNFHPNISVIKEGNQIILENFLLLTFNSSTIKFGSYNYCLGYNNILKSQKISVELEGKLLQTIIKKL